MERVGVKDQCDTAHSGDLNAALVKSVLSAAFSAGVEEFCLCPGARNSPFVMALEKWEKAYFWPEERSAAFFALGRSRATGKPVAVITTSGTAAGELLPAAMEATYSGVPLLLITADRPRRFRKTGAPQTAEQVGIFGEYADYSQDLAGEEVCDLSAWTQQKPAHLNVCFEEPLVKKVCPFDFPFGNNSKKMPPVDSAPLDAFLQKAQRPLIVVSQLKPCDRAAVLPFLQQLNAPLYLEAISGLREEPALQPLRVYKPKVQEYDAVLRIGGVPTIRLWRDLEDHPREVLSITPYPYSGLSHGKLITADLTDFFSAYLVNHRFECAPAAYAPPFEKEPRSEQALIHRLSLLIPEGSLVYLGNSMPIREWDLAAGMSRFEVHASRGVNGIDGQISTFFGLCSEELENWAVIGDLTALYDLAAPWILPQLKAKKIALVVVNNGGGQIFKPMFPSARFLNEHNLCFESVAKFWGVQYERWDAIPEKHVLTEPKLIEIVPDGAATERFWREV